VFAIIQACKVSLSSSSARYLIHEGASKVLGRLVMRWGMRNFLLICPSCKNAASAIRGRYLLGQERLTCDRC
jgi:hypothetical protein